MEADLLIYNIKKIYTPLGNCPLCGSDMENIEEIEDAYIAIKRWKNFSGREITCRNFCKRKN